MNDETAVEVTNLWKVYTEDDSLSIDVNNPDEVRSIEGSGDNVIATRDVSFTVEPQITFTIMGLSGSGKSTVVRCLIRLLVPTAGEVRINGKDVTSLDTEGLINFRRNEVGMVFQHYGLLPHRTVVENVCLGLKFQGVSREDRERIGMEALGTVGLDGWEDYYPASLSGGMQQRVGIARALAIDPPLLLLDEPFSGLDPLIKRNMQDELLQLQEEMRKTIIFVTHDLDEAIRVGSRLAIMKDGRIVQQGTPKEIMSNPADDYVRNFVKDKKKQIEHAEAQE
ncbi:ATP-binding cassette domain-containing protein [Candidatus Bipolaricaulota bacterium]|nr:ATP-binding cassette domain-containing protein [Candidatus Bipolaricaulota bacterium]